VSQSYSKIKTGDVFETQRKRTESYVVEPSIFAM